MKGASRSSSCRRLMSVNVEDGGSKIGVLDMGHDFFAPTGNEHHYYVTANSFFVSFFALVTSI